MVRGTQVPRDRYISNLPEFSEWTFPNMKLNQKSFKQQSLKCMPLLPWLQHFHTNKLHNLLSLPEGTCLPNMNFVRN